MTTIKTYGGIKLAWYNGGDRWFNNDWKHKVKANNYFTVVLSVDPLSKGNMIPPRGFPLIHTTGTNLVSTQNVFILDSLFDAFGKRMSPFTCKAWKEEKPFTVRFRKLRSTKPPAARKALRGNKLVFVKSVAGGGGVPLNDKDGQDDITPQGRSASNTQSKHGQKKLPTPEC